MKPLAKAVPLALALTFAPAALRADVRAPGFDLSVLVDGVARPEYAARGTVYVEAVRGREYALRVTNPTGRRAAVALSVDGLNTIDAKRSDARSARKWIVEPYGSIVIEGWQVSNSAARKFFFTTETNSYGALLGKTRDLGVLEAVVFLEKEPVWRPRPQVFYEKDDDGRGRKREESARDAERQPPAAAAPRASGLGAGAAMEPAPPMEQKKAQSKLSDDFAATGMGDRTRHDVTQIAMDLEDQPAATIRIRYEYRPELVRLGVLPRSFEERPLARRERSRGFSDSYCPEPQ